MLGTKNRVTPNIIPAKNRKIRYVLTNWDILSLFLSEISLPKPLLISSDKTLSKNIRVKARSSIDPKF